MLTHSSRPNHVHHLKKINNNLKKNSTKNCTESENPGHSASHMSLQQGRMVCIKMFYFIEVCSTVFTTGHYVWHCGTVAWTFQSLYLSLEKTLVIDLKESLYIIIPVHNHPRERLSILFFKSNVVTYWTNAKGAVRRRDQRNSAVSQINKMNF